MTLILAFGSKARQGKDVAGEAVVAFYQREAARIKKAYGPRAPITVAKLYKFADALYQECREKHGMIEKDPILLQKVGMVRREENPNYWVDKVAEAIGRDKPDVAVITDVRFPNEADFIRSHGGATVNVTRLSSIGTPYVAGDRPSDHPSETALDSYLWNYYIKAYSGEPALVEQYAILIAEFERARRP